jgi:regulator of protease activity HflC (stomatin/prohibitin superfamily)
VSHINISGGDRTKEDAKALAEAIETVLAAAHDYRADQKTTRQALRALEAAGAPGNTSIHGCNFQGGCH